MQQLPHGVHEYRFNCRRDESSLCVMSGGSWNSYSGCQCPAGLILEPFDKTDCVPASCPVPGPTAYCQLACPDGFARDPDTGCKMCECLQPVDCSQRPLGVCEAVNYCAVLQGMCANLCQVDEQCPSGWWCDGHETPSFCKPYMP